MLSVERALSNAKIPLSNAELFPCWDEALKHLPPEGPFFLRPEWVQSHARALELDADTEASLLKAAEIIGANQGIAAISWYAYQAIFKDTSGLKIPNDNLFAESMGDKQKGCVNLLPALALYDRVIALHRKLGISEDITHDTLCFSESLLAYRAISPGPGLLYLGWLHNYLTRENPLVRVGRMVYRLMNTHPYVEVYRSAEGATLALAKPGHAFTRDGYLYQKFEDPEGWTSRLIKDDKQIVGTPISPYGMASRQEVALNADKWKLVMGTDEYYLDMHIPGGGKMTLEACRDSFERAFELFPKWFPDKPPRAIVSVSWIFNTQFEEASPDSNLAKLDRECYLFPAPSTGRDGMLFLFSREYKDEELDQAPRDTSVRRTMLDILKSGQRLRRSGMFILKEDLPFFGTGRYRATAFGAR